MPSDGYSLLDSGAGQKLERFGAYTLARPAAQAVWQRQHPDALWNKASALFTRDGSNQWIANPPLPTSWHATIAEMTFKLSPTDFGHIGLFPEQRPLWRWLHNTITAAIQNRPSPPRLLNLFAYTGGATIAAARAGATVCHVDASKPTVAWARDNASLNNLDNAPIRWITDDVTKFLQRELRRGQRYDIIILDPPTFGRGPNGELFKIEEQISPLLHQCCNLLSDNPLALLFSCHTPGFSPLLLHYLLKQSLKNLHGHCTNGEMTLDGDEPSTFPLPSGSFAIWSPVAP